MDIKKSLKDVAVLVSICVVFATVLAFVNSITAPIIADQLAGAANEAYEAVMPGGKFEDVDLSAYTLPSTVVEAKRETSGKGYAIKLETKGYATGMVIIVGVDMAGVVTGATCVTSNETWGLEKTFGDKTVGKDINTIVDVEAGATSMTINGYRSAVKDAINAATIFGGGSADIRTPEQILSDNLNSALGTEGAEFTRVFLTEVVSAEKLYKENNGAGYVAVVDGKFVGVNADGEAVKVFDAETNEVTEGVDELKSTAVSSVATITSATELTEIDLTLYEGIKKSIQSVKVTATGNYIVNLKISGYGINGEYGASDEYIFVDVAISAEGKIIDLLTVSEKETPNIGGVQLADGAYNSQFIGKDQAGASEVDIVAGVTMTTSPYKSAVINAFKAVTIIIEGGAANE